MTLVARKLLTIVTEAGLESRLVQDITKCGAKGFTITPSHGHGPKNLRIGDLEGGNIKLETVLSDSALESCLEMLNEKYIEHYTLTTWVSEVRVLRGDRY